MFDFHIEPQISLITVTRIGSWDLATVAAYEKALRQQLADLKRHGEPTFCIVDVRSAAVHSREVADALRAAVQGLGPLHASRTAVVASSAINKLQARQIARLETRIFTSMVLARDWIMGKEEAPRLESAEGMGLIGLQARARL